ncbi:MAG: DUF4410 domain-containing protein [Methylovulum sp.]|nr:DUF4410 domain-containing protein [Methylovulum sp.]
MKITSSIALLAVLFVIGCAKTVVQERITAVDAGIARPKSVLIGDFAVNAADIKTNSSLLARMKRSMGSESQAGEAVEVGRETADALAAELVQRITALGFNVQRIQGTQQLMPESILIAGRFVNIDEGNNMRRALIGLGAGQSSVDTEVQVLAAAVTGYNELVAFSVHADSGNMPGAVVMGPAGAAAGTGTAATLAINAGMGGVKAHRSASAQQAKQIADQIVGKLSVYFAQQGWISSDSAK